ncbi:MAG TPA: hypothetical protein VH835_17435 [Dongiaceae bacterium]|jgi:hypothetical protein
MTAAEIRAATLQQLLLTREKMMSTRWMLKLRTATSEQKQASAMTLLQVQDAILKLQNAKLADLRDKLTANEQALGEGITSLKSSLRTIESIKVAVLAVGQFLQIVGRVVRLLAA